MNKLTIISKNGQFTIGSREVAVMVEKRHSDLLESIKGYEKHLLSGNFRSVDFFIKDTYKDSTGRFLSCYLLTKKGCDMVANKMTGAKGVLFTAEYVTRFEEMEKQLKTPILTIKQLLVLDIYEGGIKALNSHKKLTEIEVNEATKKLKDGNNRIITGSTVVEMLGIKGLTTTLLNKWFCENGFGEFTKLMNERNRFFSPNEKFEKYVAYEGYSLTGSTAKNNKTKVFYSTSMVDRLQERHMKSIVNFIKSEKGEQIVCQ